MLHLLLRRVVFTACLSCSSAGLAEEAFSDLYVFGDSLSDAGNLAALPDFAFLNNPNLPYDGGFSNGPRGVQVLADLLGLRAEPSLHLIGPAIGTNFAVAGARANGERPIDLTTQVDAFLLDVAGVAPPRGLYVMFAGGNDVADARDESNPYQAARIISDAAEAVENATRRLIAAGARSIMVVNSADVGSIPETRALATASADPRLIRRTRLQTRWFNQLVSYRIRRLERQRRIDIVEFDLFRFFTTITTNASALGFSNMDAPCFSSATLTFAVECAFGANFDEFVFFDEIHPTSRVHERTARALFALVPRPSSGVGR